MLTSKRILALWIIAVLLTAGSLPAYAGGDAAAMTGKVKDVDLKEKSVVVGGAQGDVVVYVEDGTRINEGGAARSLRHVRVGSIVRLTYTTVAGEKVAQTISITP